jgi:hypothetical protein
MKYLRTYNESIRDQMTPKTEEELVDSIDKFIKNTNDRLENGDDFVYDDVLDMIEYIKQIKKIDSNELLHLLIDEIDGTPEEKLDWVLGISDDMYGDEPFEANAIISLLKVMEKK